MSEKPVLVKLVNMPKEAMAETIMNIIKDLPRDQQLEIVAALADMAKILPRPLSDILNGAAFTVASRVPGGEYIVAASMIWSMFISILSMLPTATLALILLRLS